MPRKKLLLVFNPKAGKEEILMNIYEVLDIFTRAGYTVTAYPTQGKRDAYNMVAEYGSDYDLLVCAGGDGTLNETIDALMTLEERPVLGYIPCGTTNDFATTLGLPKDILLAARNICEGTPYPVDIGGFAQEYFSYVAAFGLFTDVSYDTPQDLKNLFGHAAYMLEGVKRLASIQHHSCTVTIDEEEEISGEFVFGMVSNSASIGGFKLPGGREPVLNDGLFEVSLLKRIRRVSDLQDIVGILMGNGKTSDSLIVRRAARIEVRSDKPLKWTLDGEFGGDHDSVRIQNIKNAINIIVPSGEGQ